MKTYQRALWLLLAFLCLTSAGVWRAKILAPLVPKCPHVAPPADMPPTLLFTTVALGGFRGILADLLWMRVINLQESGDVLEIAQLSDWITTMAPHVVEAWTFHAWNMAYNVSVMFPEYEDRWRWICHGIALLRDRALLYNPGQPALLHQLGWIYQHKIGFVMDAGHQHYKLRLAQEMTTLFNHQLPGQQIPSTPEAILILREKYKLQPEIMAALERDYGALDWRLPATHALYWAYQGRQADAELPGTRDCYIMFYQSMTELFRHGQLQLNPDTGFYMTTPALNLLPGTIRAYEEALTRFNLPVIHQAYANFLAEATVLLYTYNRRHQALEHYQLLIKKYPNPQGDLALDDFVLTAISHNIAAAPPEDVVALIEGFFYQSWLWAAIGDTESATGAADVAQMFWHRYMQTRRTEDHYQRTGLPPLDALRRQALQRAMNEFPTELSTPLKNVIAASQPDDSP